MAKSLRRQDEAPGSDADVVLGNYRRVRVLQSGQNGEIWQVTEIGASQPLVMKLLLPGQETKAILVKTLKQEVAVGRKLDHPNIIRVHAFGKAQRRPYVLMEYFPATNLKLRLMRNEYETFLRGRLRMLLEQAASALEHMHQKGWVHRDVKPDNILVSATGQVRLIDFALAVRAPSSLTRWLRRAGSKTAGTGSYMSPEQIRGRPVDRRADVYSFGVMTYELVAGRLPFVADSHRDLLRKHITASVPPVDPDRGVTPQFAELLGRMLVKDDRQRLPTLADFLEGLRTIKIFEDESQAQAQGRGP